MKAVKESYLFILTRKSAEAAFTAYKVTRSLNLRVLAQLGDYALIVQATREEAERLFAQGFFKGYTRKRVSPETLKEMDESLQEIVSSWNAQCAPAYQKRKKEYARMGHSWGAKDYKEPAPYAVIDPDELIALATENRKRKKLSIDPRNIKPEIQFRSTILSPAELEEARQYFKRYVKRDKYAYQLTQIFYRAKKADRIFFLNPEWLAEILDILLHAIAGEEPSCLKMHGRNSVGIVFVESSRRDGPKFSSTRRAEIEAEIRSGLSFLVGEHPSGNLVWVYDVHRARIDVDNDNNLDGSDTGYDGYWRNPAMGEIEFEGHTFTANTAGIDAYRDAMRAHHGSQHATVFFVTAFGLSWHAYSSGNRFIAMGEHGDDWGGWGQDMINIISAHEMSHQFGAADEYSGSGTPCSSCWGEHGCDNIPNGNCESCGDPSLPCIMKNNELNICQYTRAQIGWSDIFVQLWTSNDWWSGTDDSVELDIGDRTFNLDTPDHDDRETGHREGYAVWAGGNLSRNSIKRILIRKSPDGFSGGWKMHRIRVMHDGAEISDRTPDVWLEDFTRWFLAEEFNDALVNKLKLKVTTADEWWAGTDDDVTLKLSGHSWDIDSNDNDFERDSSRTYNLDPKTSFYVSDLNTITIKKSPDGLAGGWKLKGLKLTVNGVVVYENNNINLWLEDDDRTFSDAI